MLSWLKSLLFGKSLDAVLNETKTVRINGIRFKIKRIDTMDFLDGSKVMLQHYDTYKIDSKGTQEREASHKKIREHMKHILCAGVVHPKLSLDDSTYNVEKLFVNIKLVNELYEQIVNLTYGKKKIL